MKLEKKISTDLESLELQKLFDLCSTKLKKTFKFDLIKLDNYIWVRTKLSAKFPNMQYIRLH
jgi:hypothetical protein